MVDIRIGRHNFEVIASAPPIVKTTRFVSEVLHDQQADSAAQLHIGRHNFEVVAAVPPAVKTTRFVAEVMHDQQADSAAQLHIGRQNSEVLGEMLASAKTTRFVAEVMHDQQPDAAAQLQVGRLNWEVLARRFIKLDTCPVPNFWRFFSHNFADDFEVETLFRTAVSRGAESLSEDRTQMFERPRRTVKVRWSEKGLDNLVTNGKTNLMDLIQALREWKTNDWMIPFASDQGWITEQAAASQNIIKGDFSDRRFFIGGRVAVVQVLGDRNDVQTPEGVLAGVHVTILKEKTGTGEFVLQDNLPNAIAPFRGYLVPLICVHPRLLDTINQIHGRLWDLEMEFEERAGSTAIPPLADDLPSGFDSYRGLPIFRSDHDFNRALRIEVLQEGEQVEVGRGKLTFARGATQRIKHRIRLLGDREYAWPYIEFFETRRGRLRSFWLIDQEDLFTVTDIEPNFIDVRKLGDLTEFEKDGQFFGFMLNDGRCFVREILSVADLPTAWRLSVVDTLPAGLNFADVKIAGRARHTRMIEDRLKERWLHTDAVRLDIPTISLLEEKDVTLDP